MRISASLVLSAIALIASAAPQDDQPTKVPPAPTLPPAPTFPTKEPPVPTVPTKEPPAPTLPPPPTKEPPAPTLPPAPTSTHPTPTTPTLIIDPPPRSPTVVNPTIIDPPPYFAPVQCICPERQKLLCCKGVVSSLEDLARERLKELGIELEGINVPVGVSCVPYDPVSGARCPGEVVCCQDTRKPEIAAVGCASVSVGQLSRT